MVNPYQKHTPRWCIRITSASIFVVLTVNLTGQNKTILGNNLIRIQTRQTRWQSLRTCQGTGCWKSSARARLGPSIRPSMFLARCLAVLEFRGSCTPRRWWQSNASRPRARASRRQCRRYRGRLLSSNGPILPGLHGPDWSLVVAAATILTLSNTTILGALPPSALPPLFYIHLSLLHLPASRSSCDDFTC